MHFLIAIGLVGYEWMVGGVAPPFLLPQHPELRCSCCLSMAFAWSNVGPQAAVHIALRFGLHVQPFTIGCCFIL